MLDEVEAANVLSTLKKLVDEKMEPMPLLDQFTTLGGLGPMWP